MAYLWIGDYFCLFPKVEDYFVNFPILKVYYHIVDVLVGFRFWVWQDWRLSFSHVGRNVKVRCKSALQVSFYFNQHQSRRSKRNIGQRKRSEDMTSGSAISKTLWLFFWWLTRTIGTFILYSPEKFLAKILGFGDLLGWFRASFWCNAIFFYKFVCNGDFCYVLQTLSCFFCFSYVFFLSFFYMLFVLKIREYMRRSHVCVFVNVNGLTLKWFCDLIPRSM